jgi:hypothetical protein
MAAAHKETKKSANGRGKRKAAAAGGGTIKPAVNCVICRVCSWNNVRICDCPTHFVFPRAQSLLTTLHAVPFPVVLAGLTGLPHVRGQTLINSLFFVGWLRSENVECGLGWMGTPKETSMHKTFKNPVPTHVK